jgi:hypothetical protein
MLRKFLLVLTFTGRSSGFVIVGSVNDFWKN